MVQIFCPFFGTTRALTSRLHRPYRPYPTAPMAGFSTSWRSPLLAGPLLLFAPALLVLAALLLAALLLAGCGDDPGGPGHGDDSSGPPAPRPWSASPSTSCSGPRATSRSSPPPPRPSSASAPTCSPSSTARATPTSSGSSSAATSSPAATAPPTSATARRWLEGPPLPVRVDGEAVTVGGAEVTDADHETGNGVLHEVDEVVRDHLTLAERLRVTPLVGAFAGALRTAGLGGLVEGGEPYTLLIPINSAFANLGAADLQALLSAPNRNILLKVLRHHILPGRVRAEQFTDGNTLSPLGGLPLPVETTGGLTYVGGSRVIVPEIETSDGLIYLLDAVVLSHLDLAPAGRPTPSSTRS